MPNRNGNKIFLRQLRNIDHLDLLKVSGERDLNDLQVIPLDIEVFVLSQFTLSSGQDRSVLVERFCASFRLSAFPSTVKINSRVTFAVNASLWVNALTFSSISRSSRMASKNWRFSFCSTALIWVQARFLSPLFPASSAPAPPPEAGNASLPASQAARLWHGNLLCPALFQQGKPGAERGVKPIKQRGKRLLHGKGAGAC